MNFTRRRRDRAKIERLKLDFEKCKAALEMERMITARLGGELGRADNHVQILIHALATNGGEGPIAKKLSEIMKSQANHVAATKAST